MDHQSDNPDHHCIYDDLFKSLCLIENKDELKLLMEDLCTPQELKSMSERWRVAQLVDKGISYRKINEMTGVSTATITRVSRSLSLGSGGYKLLIDAKERTKNEEVKNSDTEKRPPK